MKQYTPEELNKLSKEEIVALLMQSQKEAALFKERLEELQMHLFWPQHGTDGVSRAGKHFQ